MLQNYTSEFKKKIVRFHEEEGCTYKTALFYSFFGVSQMFGYITQGE